MNCLLCSNKCIKKGFQRALQKYFCKCCKVYQQKTYKYRICRYEDEKMITKLNNEGVGISGIARITGMSKANVINKIKLIGSKITKQLITEEQQEYEVDELQTYVQNKNERCYIMYALNKNTRQVVDFMIGNRTKENINKIISKLIALKPKMIFTDRLNIYPLLIERRIHTTIIYKINHIERFNLNLRTHLKRLTRKTICFSKSKVMLENCLKIYLKDANSSFC
ncbi:MAG: IS1 family transposase [Bacteroidia bacterium]